MMCADSALPDQHFDAETLDVAGIPSDQNDPEAQRGCSDHQIHRPAPRAATSLFEPAAQKPIVVGRLISKGDPVSVGRLN